MKQSQAVSAPLAVRQLWKEVTGQQACQPASTAFISQHPLGAPGWASPNGCQPTKAGRITEAEKIDAQGISVI